MSNTDAKDPLTKAAEQGTVVIDAAALSGHEWITTTTGEDGQVERYDRGDDVDVGAEMAIGELGYSYKPNQKNLVQTTKSFLVSEEGLPLLFTKVNGMVKEADIVFRGVLMTTHKPKDRSSFTVSLAIRGLFTIRNTGFFAFQEFDLVCADKPPKNEKKFVTFSRLQRGGIFPVLFPLQKILDRFSERHIDIQRWQEELLEAVRSESQLSGVTPAQVISDTVADKYEQDRHTWSVVGWLDEAEANGTVVGRNIIEEYGKNLQSLFRANHNVDQAKDFFRCALMLYMYINQWLLDHDAQLDPELTYTLINGGLVSRQTVYAVLYDKDVFEAFGDKIIGMVTKGGLTGAKMDVWIG